MTINKINPRDMNKPKESKKVPQPQQGRAKSKKIKIKAKDDRLCKDLQDEELQEKDFSSIPEIEMKKLHLKLSNSPIIQTEQKKLELEKNLVKQIDLPVMDKSLPSLLDCIEVIQDNKHIKITLTKQKNRMVRLQVFLNGTEIRPSTFTGTSPAQNYWQLLKGICK